MKLFRAKTFKKDYQRLKISDSQYTKYIKYLSLLLEGKILPLEARNHTLIGNYSDFKEFRPCMFKVKKLLKIDHENTKVQKHETRYRNQVNTLRTNFKKCDSSISLGDVPGFPPSRE